MNANPSLRRQLLVWLLLPQLVLWLVGGALAYRIALNSAEKALDQSLLQSVRSLARQIKPIGSGLLVDFPRAAQAIIEEEPDDRVNYMVSSPPGRFIIGNHSFEVPPQPPQANLPQVYQTEQNGRLMRAVALDLPYGEAGSEQWLRVQLAKSYVARDRIARELIADLLAPLLALGALLSLLVYAGIKRGMHPLTRLEAQLQGRAPDDLTPLELTTAPREVYALVTAINRLLASVSRNLVQEKRFLDDAAHQLRTPLAGIISQTDLALQEETLAAVKARLLKVQGGAQRSAHLVSQLLTLARSGVAAPRQALDLAHLAQSVARDYTPRALSAGVDLGYEGLAQAQVLGSELLLREALGNLIDNALRYGCPAQGGRITISVKQAEGRTALCVEDNGPGLSADQRAQAFDRFWRGNEQPGGCGLGLAIVQVIARSHNGEASLESVSPNGLRASVSLSSA
jgi:two-component system sensor histidine kinase TctE